MKHKLLLKLAVILLVCSFFGCAPEDETEKLGTIYGTVTDFTNSEPVINIKH